MHNSIAIYLMQRRTACSYIQSIVKCRASQNAWVSLFTGLDSLLECGTGLYVGPKYSIILKVIHR